MYLYIPAKLSSPVWAGYVMSKTQSTTGIRTLHVCYFSVYCVDMCDLTFYASLVVHLGRLNVTVSDFEAFTERCLPQRLRNYSTVFLPLLYVWL